MNRVWIDEVELSPMNREITEEDIEIAIEERTASGKLVSDLIAIKNKITIDYSLVTDEIRNQLSELYRRSGARTLKIERENGDIDTYKVKLRPFSRSRYLIGPKWYWKNISIELEEI